MSLPELDTLVAWWRDRILPLALEEDLGPGDITTEAILEPGKTARAVIEAKDELVLCGLPFLDAVFEGSGGVHRVKHLARDGESLKRGQAVYEVEGTLAALLSRERVALNLLQRLTGIASKTATFVKTLEGTRVKLLDTRKTAPGLRLLEKYAVRTGGGENHRIGLYDLYLVKDNHIAACGGSIAEAVRRVRQHAGKNGGKMPSIEVECKTLEQVREAVDQHIDIIMLDNMDDLKLRQAVPLIDRRAKIEVSGNVSLGRLPNLARLEIDYISCGALTHSAPAKDLSMNFH
ncbi:MAG: carboxylating nicotinate-nucleotide diphosphorylase [Spirochaetes bacterium]|nr:carboxylating nicotinate-nucleotide diphosphorylase [Spirochaetota bacterium]